MPQLTLGTLRGAWMMTLGEWRSGSEGCARVFAGCQCVVLSCANPACTLSPLWLILCLWFLTPALALPFVLLVVPSRPRSWWTLTHSLDVK